MEEKKNKELRDIISLLKSLEKEIKDEYKARIVGVFGSFVRGEQKEASDIDILVEFYKGATLFEFVGLSNFLEEEIGIKVDVVPYDTVRKEIKEQVFKEAVYL